MLLQGGDVGERNRGGHAVEAGEADVAGRVLNDVAIQIGEWTIGADERSHVHVAEQSVEAGVAARFVGKQVRLATIGRAAQRVARRAVHANADKVGEGLPGIGRNFLGLWRVRAKHGGDIGGSVFQDGVGGGDRAHVAAGAREGYPGRRRVLSVGGQHVEHGVGGRRRGRIKQRIGPVSERHAEVGCSVGIEVAETVAHGNAVAVAIHAG